MHGLFGYDGPVNRVLNKVVELLCVSLLWCICSIPLITIGASTTALYYTVNKVCRQGRSTVLREFWSSFRADFKQSTIVWMILAVLYYALVTSLYAARLLYLAGFLPKVMLSLLLIVITVISMCAIYLFPYIARFSNTTGRIVINSGRIAMMNFFWSILLLVVAGITMVVVLTEPVTILILPAGSALISSYILERVFGKYMSPEDRLVTEDISA